MDLDLEITDDETPPFEQIRARITQQAGDGTLPVGLRLPPVRTLAEQLALAVNTVAKAYKALEADGVIETRGRAGSFVSARGGVPEQAAAAAATQFAQHVRRLGLTQQQALAAAESAIRATYA